MTLAFPTCFISVPLLGSGFTHSQYRPCTRRPKPQLWRSQSTISCKLQRQQPSADRPEDEEPLESILPPPILPTLNTLTNNFKSSSEIQNESHDADEDDPTDVQPVLQMGVGIPLIDKAIRFLVEVVEEFKMIEFPSFSRVIRLSIVVLITIVVATLALYVVDGFFYRAARFLFERDF